MAKNKSKEKFMATPIEQHNTAAWANVEKQKEVSKVTIPSEIQALNAKEHADENQK